MSYRQYINLYEGERGSKRQHIASSLKKYADFYREVSPPDSLSSFTTGTPVGDSENPDGTKDNSALPDGDSARNIGRPSPDSPNLKYRNLDKSEANLPPPWTKTFGPFNLEKSFKKESKLTSLSIIFPPIFITFSVFISKFLKYFLTLFEQHMFYYLLDQLPVSYYHPELHLLQQHFFLRVNNA